MGAWGEASFENDDALDFLAELRSRGIDAISDAISTVTLLNPDEYLEAPQAARAVAAAEVLAAVLGSEDTALLTDISDWLEEAPVPEDSLRVSALIALDRILISSELAELWSESGGDSWRAQVVNLRDRLSAQGDGPGLGAGLGT